MKREEEISKCQPTEHAFQYQLMSSNTNGSMPLPIEKRILFCTKCGEIRDLESILHEKT